MLSSKPTTIHENRQSYNIHSFVIVHQHPPQVIDIVWMVAAPVTLLPIKYDITKHENF